MAAETVRVYTVDQSDDALDGVLVRFFDSGDSFVTQQYSSIVGADAYAEVTLDGDDPPVDYTIRLSKTGVAFDGQLGDDSKTPQSIEVYSPPSAAPSATNDFTVQGQTFVRPVAADPRLCRCSGFFFDHSGRPLAGVDVHFSAICFNESQPPLTPMIVDGNAVMSDKIITRTDANGYLEIDLYRNGHYSALVQSFENTRRTILVPDLPSANVVNLLFPVVAEVSFSPDPLALALDAYVDVDLTILASDGRTLDPADRDVLFVSSDTNVASIQLIGDGKLRVYGINVGSTTITATRADTSIVSFPTQPEVYTPLSVTVS